MSNVIHGTGKPRFFIKTDIRETGKIVSATSTTAVVSLNNFTDLEEYDRLYGLIGCILWTKNNADEETYGIILNYINNTDTVIVKEWTKGNPDVDKDIVLKDIVIDLPYCEQLTESWTPDSIVKKRLNGKLNKKKKGFYYSASLNYSSFIKADVLSKLRHLFRIDTKEIIFYPRRDNQKVNYLVDIDDDTLELFQLKHHQGHGGIIINVIGLNRYSEAQIYEITSLSGYGYDYGSNYGIGI